MKLSTQYFFLIVAVVGTVGYPTIASITGALNMPSGQVSFVMRAIGLFGAIVLLLRTRLKNALLFGAIELSLVVFWAIYCIRIIEDTLLYSHELGIPASKYLIFGIGVSLIPLLSILLYRGKCLPEVLFKNIYYLSFLSLPLAIIYANTTKVSLQGAEFDIGRTALDSLNPISFGHFSGLLLLLSYWYLRNRKRNLRKNLVVAFGLLIGAYGLVLSGSRGPIVAVAASLILYELSKRSIWMFVSTLILGVAVQFVSLDLVGIDQRFDVQTFSRFQSLFELSDRSTLSRLESIPSALSQFSERPVLGDFIEVRDLDNYPHNIFVEALMATGILGAVPLAIAIFGACFVSLKFISNATAPSWIALLFFQQFFASQFSGSLYGSGTLWITMGLLLYYARQDRRTTIEDQGRISFVHNVKYAGTQTE